MCFSTRAYAIEMAATTVAAPPIAATKSVSPTWRRFQDAFRRHPTAVLGGLILVCMVAIAILAPWLGTIDPQAVAPIKRLKPPSADYWFGTDMLGRDVYSRVVYGARVSLVVGLAVAMFSTFLGAAIGLITGYVRSLDAVVMRVMDGLMSIPSVLLAIALMALTRASIGNVIAAITLAEVPRVVRLVRSLVLSLREQPYVEAAIAAGTTLPRILVRHILPNIVAPLLVQATYVCGSAMITEAILSFIGAGTPPNIPSWGNIMAEGRSLIQIAAYLIIFPGICLSLTVLAVNLLGDGMRDALDPRLARRL
jgi:peptide/nickel transport system permease protein